MNKKKHLSSLVLRRYRDDDIAFMLNLYGTTRENELSVCPFSEYEKKQFIHQQFHAQLAHYVAHYCPDHFNIIEYCGCPIGRFFVDYWDKEVRVVDITLTPEFRNQGIGSHLLLQLINQSQSRSLPVSIHVEVNNPAKRLYERLGFVFKSYTNEIYVFMQTAP